MSSENIVQKESHLTLIVLQLIYIHIASLSLIVCNLMTRFASNLHEILEPDPPQTPPVIISMKWPNEGDTTL